MCMRLSGYQESPLREQIEEKSIYKKRLKITGGKLLKNENYAQQALFNNW